MASQDAGPFWFVDLTSIAEGDLEQLDTAVRRRVLAKMQWLRDNFDYIVPQPLGGKYRGFFKLRVGDWRIVYEVESDKKLLTVHFIDRRDKIYKRL